MGRRLADVDHLRLGARASRSRTCRDATRAGHTLGLFVDSQLLVADAFALCKQLLGSRRGTLRKS